MRAAIDKNKSGSSLYDIDVLLETHFGSSVVVFDYLDMEISYLASTLGPTADVLALFISQGFLPKPMGVGVSITYAPDILFFGFSTYSGDTGLNKPFNNYSSIQPWPWLTYQTFVF